MDSFSASWYDSLFNVHNGLVIMLTIVIIVLILFYSITLIAFAKRLLKKDKAIKFLEISYGIPTKVKYTISENEKINDLLEQTIVLEKETDFLKKEIETLKSENNKTSLKLFFSWFLFLIVIWAVNAKTIKVKKVHSVEDI